MLGKIRLALWVVVVVAALGAIVFALRPPPTGYDDQGGLAIRSIGGPFTLTGSDGKPFGSQQLAGRPYAIFFGFTHCPDVCPTTLARLTNLRRQLGDGDRSFDILFVTVDPERDGPTEVGAYSALFSTPIIGLTGSPAVIDQVKKQFGVFSEKVGDGDNYGVNHTATIFLMGRDGKFVSTISPDEKDVVALEKLKRLTA